MANTTEDGDERADDEARRRQEREEGVRVRDADDSRVPLDGTVADRREADPPRTCHRRGCDEPAQFVVLERYLEETGHGAVEATAYLCTDHTREESPTNLDGVFEDYVFRVEPLAGSADSDEE